MEKTHYKKLKAHISTHKNEFFSLFLSEWVVIVQIELDHNRTDEYRFDSFKNFKIAFIGENKIGRIKHQVR